MTIPCKLISLTIKTSMHKTLYFFPIIVKTTLFFPILKAPAPFPKRGVRALNLTQIVWNTVTGSPNISTSRKLFANYCNYKKWTVLPVTLHGFHRNLKRKLIYEKPHQCFVIFIVTFRIFFCSLTQVSSRK